MANQMDDKLQMELTSVLVIITYGDSIPDQRHPVLTLI